MPTTCPNTLPLYAETIGHGMRNDTQPCRENNRRRSLELMTRKAKAWLAKEREKPLRVEED